MADRIEISIENLIAVMTIRRPEKLNALDIPLLQELSTACDQVEADSSVRVAILTGEGKAFPQAVTSRHGVAWSRKNSAMHGCAMGIVCSSGWRRCACH